MTEKALTAYRTIGEVASETGVARHVLRYWEQRFPQLRPLTRAGRRRYYGPADVALVRRIHRLLTREGYTIRGAQALLASEARKTAGVDMGALQRVRDGLAAALAAEQP